MHSLGSVAFLSMFSTSCCNFDVSDAGVESNSPPNGNFALNCSDIRGISGFVKVATLLEPKSAAGELTELLMLVMVLVF